MPQINTTRIYLRTPKLNPSRWMKAENGLQDYFVNSLSRFESKADYVNPFEKSDPINCQHAFNMDYVSSYKVQLIDCAGNVHKTASIQTMYTSTDRWRWVHFNMIPLNVNEGIYYQLLTVTLYTGQTDLYISEPIDLRTTWENTLWVDYANSTNDFDMIFSRAGIGITRIDTKPATTKAPYSALYRLRVKGGYWSGGYTPASDDVVYTSQTWNFRTVSSIPYNVKKVTFGDGYGVPNYIYDILNRIFACDNIKINEERINKIEGATLEATRLDRYPMASLSIDIAPYDNEYSDEYSYAVPVKPMGVGFEIIGFNFYVR